MKLQENIQINKSVDINYYKLKKKRKANISNLEESDAHLLRGCKHRLSALTRKFNVDKKNYL